MKENFAACLKYVLGFEGGYSDLAEDPGGATNLGITQAELTRYRGHAVSKDDVRNLKVDEAGEIYRLHYWQPMRCDDLPAGIDLAVFDCAVNQGTGRAGRFLQLAVHANVDGIVGPKTLGAVMETDADHLLIEFMAQRMNAYGLLTSMFHTFGLGWSRRLMETHFLALGMRAPKGLPAKAAA